MSYLAPRVPALVHGEFEVVIRIEGVTEEMHGSLNSDHEPITSEPWLVWQNFQRQRDGALFGAERQCAPKVLDPADTN